MKPHSPTERFSDRVERYAKYRPGYPEEVYDYLRGQAGLGPDAEIADLGSGTGLLSRLFLEHGHRVVGVEPNPEMRAAAERAFAGDSRFVSLEGRAEDIPLDDQSVDFVVAGQAFHWFEPAAAKSEVACILEPGAHTALIWNNWEREFSPFLRAYGDLLDEFGTDYLQVRRQSEDKIAGIFAFFAPHEPHSVTFPNQQVFDLDSLRGRLLSSSYTPLEGQRGHDEMLARLEEIFRAHQKDGRVLFEYKTTLHHAPVKA